ncbi:uncharacterized protein PV07_07149 [Cladophialophora immunda]|uniref:Transcription factor domain-containing protein n=1 Tax=Cladophialophora immunda TaxID=569365 RepID=A0A0D1ZHG9_9EURO|nr:uncharacterized protein PV07_07149 [Cladophialophora immunda]KIW27411.1 hypothetical protein PV07_07149 [Cladophialophora immunda]OQV05164.1 Fungal specific transcription factor domain-containing protein [Cladophialophora immunda]
MAHTTGTVTSQEQILPGERNPSRHDVEAATELPEPTILSDFKRSLLATVDASDAQDLMHLDLKATAVGSKAFTYPMALLLDFPEIPSQERITSLCDDFSTIMKSHVFLNQLPLAQYCTDLTTPPLRLAVACLASMHGKAPGNESRHLFLAALDLWAFMTEVDNREARSLDMLMATILLNFFGVMTTDKAIGGKMRILVCSSLTISRRMRLHDPEQLQTLLGSRISPHRGAFIWCLWLTDILYALRDGLGVHSFSVRELCTKMPYSEYDFQDIYRTLLDESQPKASLPDDMTSPDDAFLLLMAVLSDIMSVQRSLYKVVSLSESQQSSSSFAPNPFIPLTPAAELTRMNNALSSALDTWYDRFRGLMVPEIIAFRHYCGLHLTCPRILELPFVAESTLSRSDFDHQPIIITDEAVRNAWLVLDHSADAVRACTPETLCPVWLPIVVFHAALVVWAQQGLHKAGHSGISGSVRVLLAFKVELERMPWPCANNMAATLDRLMHSRSAAVRRDSRLNSSR